MMWPPANQYLLRSYKYQNQISAHTHRQIEQFMGLWYGAYYASITHSNNNFLHTDLWLARLFQMPRLSGLYFFIFYFSFRFVSNDLITIYILTLDLSILHFSLFYCPLHYAFYKNKWLRLHTEPYQSNRFLCFINLL